MIEGNNLNKFEVINLTIWLLLSLVVLIVTLLSSSDLPIVPAAVFSGGMYGQLNVRFYRIIIEQLLNEQGSLIKLIIAASTKLLLFILCILLLSSRPLSLSLSALVGFLSLIPAALLTQLSVRKAVTKTAPNQQ